MKTLLKWKFCLLFSNSKDKGGGRVFSKPLYHKEKKVSFPFQTILFLLFDN